MTKSDREIMKIFEAYDLTKTVWSAAQLTGADPKTVKRYVELRDLGLDPHKRAPLPKLIDPFLEKIEEWVEASKAKIRADVAHGKLTAMGYRGSPRSTRRAVNAAKTAWRASRRRTYRPWIPEPGMWLQFDWGEGPRVGGRRTWLWCACLSWSRFRVVIPVWDRTLGTLVACLDSALRRIGMGESATPPAATANPACVPQLPQAVQDFLKALANPGRQQIMLLFAQGAELSVNQVAERAGISQSAASQQLALLRRSGIVISRRDGKEVLYRGDRESITRILGHLQDYLKFCC
ncbi:metalloregulator ArsR/SmtB family transcription factor [Spongiactinospora sp. TRM90649]|uniref:metalloregulator ArsR/SmtB family transcription factor n=1 Tax=Spongiactinospora sp. TRM90649 TaxID=3031114 RepID=UPI0023F89CBE|nr:metalloregulator ArsR/SmtB family transcription factor [Spongiactinospora sp. TRM90649]MDF5759024.1 metalloregulator ArsR/SmtB family transcription factor [Spongiactinospora sp. TRM90649]